MTYYGYRASDGTLIRTITCTVPEKTFADFAAVWAASRDSSANADYIIHDAVRDEDGHLTEVTDGRGIETHYTYDDAGRETVKIEAFGRNRSRGGARKLKIDLDAKVRFRPKYLHEQNTAGTRS
jgi:YD repeat-containing protein